MTFDWIVPDWPAPANVRALSTTRSGGCSVAPFESMNLGNHVGDNPDHVAQNRHSLRTYAGLEKDPCWLSQVHGTHVVDAAGCAPGAEADASYSTAGGVCCAVMTADCLPVLFCSDDGRCVAAAHAGWRGLLDGILEGTVAGMPVASANVMAWLGPAIGPATFEVGQEVYEGFVSHSPQASRAFEPHGEGKFLADIYALARQRLHQLGVGRIYGGGLCTFSDEQRFFSYRRDGITGRMASLIWME